MADASDDAGREAEPTDSDPRDTESDGGRQVSVPLAVYKVVTVFSTLIAIVSVVAGFLVLDAATRRARAPPSEIDPLLTAVGLGLIAAGGIVYAFSARFHVEDRSPEPDPEREEREKETGNGKGKDKSDTAEDSDDG